ncbi:MULTISPECIES: hypothetical protein [Cupriavidus]|nr:MULTISPECIES: hypothetical protein [Cupriavidus]MDT6962657.1 hypothetical protein [Cupriavidus sp. SZY C1]
MNKFLTRLLEDDEFQGKAARRLAWGVIIYTTLTILFCEWLRQTGR